MVTKFHLCEYDNGHEPSEDCWCEPIPEHGQGPFGEHVMIVLHVDEMKHHRRLVVAARGAAQDWITQILEKVGKDA